MNMKTTKVSFNLPNEMLAKVKALATLRGDTSTSVIVGAINTYLYINERLAEGAKVLIQEKDGSMKQLVFFREHGP